MAGYEEERSKLASVKKRLLKLRGKCCERCGEGEGIEAHHKIALSNGGTNDVSNLVLLCHSCHRNEWHKRCEGNMTFDEFMESPTLKEYQAIHKGMIENPDVPYPVALAIIEGIRKFRRSCGDLSDDPKAGVSKHLKDAKDIPNDGFLSSVVGSVLQTEIEQDAERTSSSLQHRKARREAYCSAVYGWNKKDKKLERNIDEQHVIGLMVKWHGGGASFNQISIRLNEMGVVSKRGGQWHRRSVRTVVLNEGIHDFEDLVITDPYVALP